jgi:hypothetical protein
MQRERKEMRDEILATLAVARDLSPDADEHLAETLLERLTRRTRERGGMTPRKTFLGSGARLGLGVVAVLSIILLPLIMWGSSHTMPERAYLTRWLIMIGAALLSIMVMAFAVIRERICHSIV